jgi:transcription elongation GreA/GreB family factor
VSRAFVKESDREIEPQVARPERRRPYYVTAAGFERVRRDHPELADEAVVVDPAEHKGSSVDFGATVTIELPDKKTQRYQIVGEDEADPLKGTISWTSPLAQALWNKRPGSRAMWERPAGNIKIRIVSVEYV